MTDRDLFIKQRMELYAANIADFEVNDLVKELDGTVSKITNKTINSIEVEIDKKKRYGIKSKQWFAMDNFNRRFKKI